MDELKRRMIGVLGGMGPLATVDFMRKVIDSTPARIDQDHIPLVVYSVPQIPDRMAAIESGTDDAFIAILAGLRVLESAGAELIVMPCNTAHTWFDRLACESTVEIFHIGKAVVQHLGSGQETIGLLATTGTLGAGFYQRYLRNAGFDVLLPVVDVQASIARTIAQTKAGDLSAASQSFGEAAQSLLSAGADRLLLACSELPIAMLGSPFEDRCIDATACLAEACIAFSTGSADVQYPFGKVREVGSWISDGSRTF